MTYADLPAAERARWELLARAISLNPADRAAITR